ncbi:MAG: helix-turn-helix transcriptional regulator [Bilifractor sp.]
MMDNFLAYDNLLYSLYTAIDFEDLKSKLLSHLEELIPHQYSSILLIDPMYSRKGGKLKISEFYCKPSEFMEAEKTYMEKYPDAMDRRLNISRETVSVRESSLMPEAERLHSKFYQECYRRFDIYDTLQLSITSGEDLLAVLTLFRTRSAGAFADEDVYLLKALSKHLNTIFYKHCRETDTAASVSGAVETITRRVHMTPKETEILTLIFLTKSNIEICDELGIKEHTLQKHFQNIYRKLNISSRWELLRFAHDGSQSLRMGAAS